MNQLRQLLGSLVLFAGGLIVMYGGYRILITLPKIMEGAPEAMFGEFVYVVAGLVVSGVAYGILPPEARAQARRRLG